MLKVFRQICDEKVFLCVYILSELYNFFAFMHLSAAIPGVDPRDIRGNSTGFADFCRQFLALDGALNCFCTSEARYTGKDPQDL